MTKPNAKVAWTPLLGAGLSLSRTLFRNNHVKWKQYNWLRRMMVLSMTELDLGLRIWERRKYDARIRQEVPKQGPFFIVGYWRSGTTYLHTLLSQDPQFGCLTLDHTIAPRQFLIRNPIRKYLLDALGPRSRPVDGVALGADMPQEDEFALANMTEVACYHGLYFPENFERYYIDNLEIESLPSDLQEEWMAKICYLYSKLNIKHAGKPLLLKNPPHTARISLLKKMFPHAKFIYLLRDPGQVYASAVEFKSALLQLLSFQEFDLSAQENFSRQTYPKVLQNVESALAAMPPSDHIVIRYEDLVAKPLGVCQAIYNQFDLNYEANVAAFTKFTEAQTKSDNSAGRKSVNPDWLEKEWRPIYNQHVRMAAKI